MDKRLLAIATKIIVFNKLKRLHGGRNAIS